MYLTFRENSASSYSAACILLWIILSEKRLAAQVNLRSNISDMNLRSSSVLSVSIMKKNILVLLFHFALFLAIWVSINQTMLTYGSLND
jgi:hypothetical protein